MPLGKLAGFNLDAIFAFTTPRTVAIKDGTVGLVYYAAIVAVAVALAYQIFGLEKGFYKSSAVLGSATLSTLSPTAAWTSAGLGLAQPYCAPGSTSYAAADSSSYPGVYAVYPPAPATPLGSFSFGANVAMPRLVCQATDAVWQIANPLEVNALFLPTRIVKYVETAPHCSPDPAATHTVNGTVVSNTTESECRYAPGPKSAFWLPDVEGYTLRIDHAAAAPALGLSWSKDQMQQGRIVDSAGSTVDPCAYYRRRNPSVPCPLNTQPNPTATNYISVGRAGVPDIVSLGTLLEAAGVPSLDVNGLPSTETLRYGGLTLVVQLNYDNYFSNDYTQARYSYKVQAIPGKVKGIVGASATGDIPSTDRYVFERSGVRVVLTFSGTVGRPDFTAGWTAAMCEGPLGLLLPPLK